MNLDIRTPIGYFFSLVAVILIVFGLIPNAQMYEKHSLGINVNLWWGLALSAFGLFMLAMARRASRLAKQHTTDPPRGEGQAD